MNLIKEIREFQQEMNLMIDNFCEKLILEAEKLENKDAVIKEYVGKYPLTNASGFKGKKPIGVIIDNQTYECLTWKSVVQTILQNVIEDKIMRKRLLALCDIVMGRKRKRISASSDNMKSPLKITENLYIESHYDTESLINFLIGTLEDIGYNYSLIQVKVKN